MQFPRLDWQHQQLDYRKAVSHLLRCLNIFVITGASVLATHARLSKAPCARPSLCPPACSYADLHCTLTDPEQPRKLGIYTATNRTNNYNKRRVHATRTIRIRSKINFKARSSLTTHRRRILCMWARWGLLAALEASTFRIKRAVARIYGRKSFESANVSSKA